MTMIIRRLVNNSKILTKYCCDSIIVARKKLRHVHQSTKDATMPPTTDPSIPGPSMTGATHHYCVLEKANTPSVMESKDATYYTALHVHNYEDVDAVRETSFGTDVTNKHVTRKPMSPTRRERLQHV